MENKKIQPALNTVDSSLGQATSKSQYITCSNQNNVHDIWHDDEDDIHVATD